MLKDQYYGEYVTSKSLVRENTCYFETGFCKVRHVLRLTRLILIHLTLSASLTNVTQLTVLTE